MLTRQSALRVAAASVSAVFISVGAVAPVYAAGQGGSGKADASSHASSAQGESQSQAKGHRESAQHSSRHASEESKSAGSRHQERGKAQGDDQDNEHKVTSSSNGHRAGAATTSSPSADKKPGTPASSRGKGHTAVTVCHLLGNGGYHLLTFDQHALKAHLAHGDVYPDSSGTCPTAPTSGTRGATGSHGHTRVTVCHLLGNGGYHLLTFDQHALKAHLAHGDVYPDSTGTCPVPGSTGESGTTTSGGSETTTTTEGGTTTTKTTTSTGETSKAASSVAAELAQAPTQVLGVQAARSPRVLGVEAFRSGASTTAAANGAPAQVAPAAGLLPNTGAARVGLPLVAGLGLLAAGAGLLLRRRGAARG